MNGSESVDRVAAVLVERGHPHAPRMLADSARTAQEAADALGVQLGQIAKSIVFRRRPDDALVMVVTSGDQRVDEKKLAALACSNGQKLGRADADFVRERTGFVIGGVAPLAHLSVPLLWLDLSLFRFDQVWAAAGHPHAVFAATPAQLALLTRARLDDVASMEPATRLCAGRAGWRPTFTLHLGMPHGRGVGFMHRLHALHRRNCGLEHPGAAGTSPGLALH